MSGIVTDQNDKVIVESVIALARTLKFKVVAEGVETEQVVREYNTQYFLVFSQEKRVNRLRL